MLSIDEAVYRYRRTEGGRMGEWVSVDARWKTEASAGLVGHDIYHHLPTDTGRFEQEVASLGAEWYINIQSLTDDTPLSPRNIQRFKRNVSDTVANALDSKERNPFELPARTGPLLSATEMQLFESVAEEAERQLVASADPRTQNLLSFRQRIVENLLWGYAGAKTRFPDQARVRRAYDFFVSDLADLELSEVPYGHEVTITCRGYDCQIAFSDADEGFLRVEAPLEAWLMLWCRNDHGYPEAEVSVHQNERDYREFSDVRLYEDTPALIPLDDASRLKKVYVVSPEYKATLERGLPVLLPPDVLRINRETPRGVLVL